MAGLRDSEPKCVSFDGTGGVILAGRKGYRYRVIEYNVQVDSDSTQLSLFFSGGSADRYFATHFLKDSVSVAEWPIARMRHDSPSEVFYGEDGEGIEYTVTLTANVVAGSFIRYVEDRVV
jgi:hypothetical protein